MFKGFSHFQTISTLCSLSICQPSVIEQYTLQGGEHCTVLWFWGVKPQTPPPPPTLASLHPLCPPEVPGRQLWRTTAQLWPDDCFFLRCNRNNPIKWWIAFHTDYWASVSPAGGGGGVSTAGTHTCANTSVQASKHKFCKLIMATYWCPNVVYEVKRGHAWSCSTPPNDNEKKRKSNKIRMNLFGYCKFRWRLIKLVSYFFL